jgi:hypothetical protein
MATAMVAEKLNNTEHYAAEPWKQNFYIDTLNSGRENLRIIG